jgi:hypothetical protein
VKKSVIGWNSTKAWDRVAWMAYYCQGLLFRGYHPNETGGNREDGRSWQEFASLVRQITSRLSPLSVPLVEHPKDWPWSSWANYAGKGQGKIRIDSARGGREESNIRTKSQNPHP